MSKITEVQIKIVKPKDGLVGFASLVIDQKLYISSIGIFTKLDGSGYRLTYPTKKVSETNINIFHPISKGLAREIERAVFKKLKSIFKADRSEQR